MFSKLPSGRSTSWKNSPSVTKSFPSMMLNYEVVVPTHLFSRLFKHQQQWCNLKRVSARLAMGRALAQRRVRSKVSWNFPSMGEVICKPVFRRKRASIRRWSAQSVILRFSFFAFLIKMLPVGCALEKSGCFSNRMLLFLIRRWKN